MTLTVLPTYRRRGIATMLLEHILETAAKDSRIEEVYLHVQTSNTDALQFYEKYSFENVGIIENYYKRIEPPNCYILRLDRDKLLKYGGSRAEKEK